MPAATLVRRQFASVGAAAQASLDATRTVLEATGDRVDVTDLRATVARRVAAADRFTDVYRSYRWPVTGVADLRLAPFQVLAAEGQVLIGRGHDWHMAVAVRALTRFVDREPLHRVHEAVFGVLAIESEPVDPRL